MYVFKAGVTSAKLRVKFLDSTSTSGAGKTGLTNSSSGLYISTIQPGEATATVYTQAASHINAIATLGTYVAPSANCCNIKEVDSTNHPGLYEIHLANARFNAAGLIVSWGGAAGLAQGDLHVALWDIDPFSRAYLFQSAMTENYAADGSAPTVEQAMFLIQQFLAERSISSTTLTVKGLDGSTTKATFALNDGTSPTSITRSS